MKTLKYLLVALTCLVSSLPAVADNLTLVTNVEWQPFVAQVRRLIQAKENSGDVFSAPDVEALTRALAQTDSKAANQTIQKTLDAHCLFQVQINPESRVKV